MSKLLICGLKHNLTGNKAYFGRLQIRAVARKDRARAEIKEMAYQLHAKGIKITRKHLRPLLTSSDYTNLNEGRAALRQVKEELQQEIAKSLSDGFNYCHIMLPFTAILWFKAHSVTIHQAEKLEVSREVQL